MAPSILLDLAMVLPLLLDLAWTTVLLLDLAPVPSLLPDLALMPSLLPNLTPTPPLPLDWVGFSSCAIMVLGKRSIPYCSALGRWSDQGSFSQLFFLLYPHSHHLTCAIWSGLAWIVQAIELSKSPGQAVFLKFCFCLTQLIIGVWLTRLTHPGFKTLVMHLSALVYFY